LAISSSKIILSEESTAFRENDWKIQKEKRALWVVAEALCHKEFYLLKYIYISLGEEKISETEENDLCGNSGPAVDSGNETLE